MLVVYCGPRRSRGKPLEQRRNRGLRLRVRAERAPRILVERRHCPLLVIQGLDDEVAPPGNGHALREQSVERVRVVDLPHAGHFLLLEQPEAVARAVSEFLGADNAPGR